MPQNPPPRTQSVPRPGPGYDPMDRIIQDLQNIQSFIDHISMNHRDFDYLNTHLSQILKLRRTISQQLEMLAEDPYNYSASKLQQLHKENENVFSLLEGMIGAMNPWNEIEFKKFIKASESEMMKFDQDLTP